MSETDESDDIETIEQVPETKVKKPRTEKQIEAFKKVREKKMENTKLREKEKEKIAQEERKALEAKIVQKALSIKKKQIKKQAVLEDISDDDTPIEVIKEIKNRVKPQGQTPTPPRHRTVEGVIGGVKPKYNFV